MTAALTLVSDVPLVDALMARMDVHASKMTSDRGKLLFYRSQSETWQQRYARFSARARRNLPLEPLPAGMTHRPTATDYLLAITEIGKRIAALESEQVHA